MYAGTCWAPNVARQATRHPAPPRLHTTLRPSYTYPTCHNDPLPHVALPLLPPPTASPPSPTNQSPPASAVFRESIAMGVTNLSRDEVHQLVAKLGQEYKGNRWVAGKGGRGA